MDRIRIAGLIFDSLTNGEGLRDVLFLQGCNHACKGCQNPHTHDITSGYEMSVEELVGLLEDHSINNKVTISGGEPFLQKDALLHLLYELKQLDFNIWVYTGYKIEELMQDDVSKACIDFIDVLVDGKFEIDNMTEQDYIGSANQRIIEVKEWRKTLKS